MNVETRCWRQRVPIVAKSTLTTPSSVGRVGESSEQGTSTNCAFIQLKTSGRVALSQRQCDGEWSLSDSPYGNGAS